MPWDKPIIDIAAEAEAAVDEEVRSLAFYGFKRCVEVSPVDTGLFRQSWSIEEKQDHWLITNPQPYAERLDEGWSSQAPDGISAIVIADMAARR